MKNFNEATLMQFSPTMSSESGSCLPSVSGDFSFGTPKEFNIPELNLPALAKVQLEVREITLQRNANGNLNLKKKYTIFRQLWI